MRAWGDTLGLWGGHPWIMGQDTLGLWGGHPWIMGRTPLNHWGGHPWIMDVYEIKRCCFSMKFTSRTNLYFLFVDPDSENSDDRGTTGIGWKEQDVKYD